MKLSKLTATILVVATMFSTTSPPINIYGQAITKITTTQKAVDTKKIYKSKEELNEAVKNALTNPPKEYEFKISGISAEDVKNLNIDEFFTDQDSIGKFVSWNTRNSIPVSVKFEVKPAVGYEIKEVMEGRMKRETISQEANSLYDKVQIILAKSIKPDMDDYDKALAIHDYIVLNTAYNTTNLPNSQAPQSDYEIEGVILKGIAVCEGYAKTYKMFMDILGIDCYIIVGESKGEPHAWNAIKLDEQWYYVDVTWDDPVPDIKGYVSYEYFNITDEQLKLDHTWKNTKNIIANSNKLNYYVKNGMAAYNEADAKAIIKKAISEGKKTFTIYTYYNTDAKSLGKIVTDTSKKGCDITYSSKRFTFTLRG